MDFPSRGRCLRKDYKIRKILIFMSEKKEKKYDKFARREFLRYAGKIGLGAAIGGLIGYIPGRIYQEGKDFYNEMIEPTVEKTKEQIEDFKRDLDKGVEKYDDFKESSKKFKNRVREFFGLEEKVENEKNTNKKDSMEDYIFEPQNEDYQDKKETISRRGFLQKYFRLFHNHPEATSTTTGAFIGGTRNAIRGYTTYKRRKERTKDKATIQRMEEKIDELIEQLKKNKEGGLEDTINSGDEGPLGKTLIIVGLAGFFISVIFGSIKLTGNLISNGGISTGTYSSLGLFVLSLILIFRGLKSKK